MMNRQTGIQGQTGSSGYHPGLNNSPILRRTFNRHSGGVIIPSRHGIPGVDDLCEDFVQSASGILHRNLAQSAIPVPSRKIFVSGWTGGKAVHLPLNITPPQDVIFPVIVDHGMSTKIVSEDREITGTNPCYDPGFVERLHDGIFEEFNKRRLSLGFSTLEQAVHDNKNKSPKPQQYVDDISAITRSICGQTLRH